MRTRTLSVPLVVLAVLAALAWYLVAGRGGDRDDADGHVATADREAPDAGSSDGGRRGAGDRQQPQGTATASAGTGQGAGNRPASAGSGGQPPLPPPASTSAGAGPRALSSDGAQRIASAVAAYREHDTDFADMQYLLENEARDDAWAEAVEARIAAFLQAEAGGYSGLEIAPPRCSATVCRVAATALPGLDTEAPEANWQRLMSRMQNQPWFAATFIDMQLLVTQRGDAIVYVGTYLRGPR